jgi:two-component system OmpR family sensor kinase
VDRVTSDLPYRQRATLITDAMQFLLEVMIAYGVHHKQYMELRAQAAERQAAQARQQAAEAERLAQEKSDILALIAHELNTPITAAEGILDLVVRRLDRGQTDDLRERIGRARSAVERLALLSADLHRVSRNEPLELTIDTQDLTALAAQVCGWAMSQAREKGLRLLCPDWEEPIEVLGDGEAIVTIVSNLLSNAIRYTPEDGTVTVRIGRERDGAWIEVADTGIGMTDEQRARIFDKFYRAPEAKQTVSQGLGLGLSIVEQLVAAQNGRISVTSASGRGSCFRVVLPLAASGPQSQNRGDGDG